MTIENQGNMEEVQVLVKESIDEMETVVEKVVQIGEKLENLENGHKFEEKTKNTRRQCGTTKRRNRTHQKTNVNHKSKITQSKPMQTEPPIQRSDAERSQDVQKETTQTSVSELQETT